MCTLSPARHPAPQVLGVIGANEEIMPMAVGFMLVRAVSVPAMLVSVVAEGAYRAFLDLATPFAGEGCERGAHTLTLAPPHLSLSSDAAS